MIQNNIKIILRTLLKQKSFTFIHVVGLSLGMGCCLLIYLFIQHERSFDTYHTKADRIYRINQISNSQAGTNYSIGTPYPLAEAMRTDFSDLEKVARIHVYGKGIVETSKSEKFPLENVLFAEAELFELFDYQVLRGDALQTLAAPNKVVITAATAKNLFGDADPMEQTIKLDNIKELEIGAVIADLPANTHLLSEMIVSLESLDAEFVGGFDYDNWGVTIGTVTYALLPESYTTTQLAGRLEAFAKKYMNTEEGVFDNQLYLQPLREIHFDTRYTSSSLQVAPIRPAYLWIFACVGLFVLTIACFNFINLSTVQAIKRAKEVGVRKVLGAGRKQLILQYLGEALAISMVSGLLAALVTQLVLPSVNKLVDKQISPEFFQSPATWLFLLAVVLLVSFLSGLYPALFLARYEPVKVLKSQTTAGNRSSLFLRRSLVVAQFTITLALIIGTLTISQQVKFLKNTDLGFDKNAVLLLKMPERDHFDQLRTEWMRHPNISNVSFGIGAPTSQNNISTSFYPKGLDEASNTYRVAVKAVDENYYETFGLELAAGRWLTEADARRSGPDVPEEEKEYKFVVNEALVRKIGYAKMEGILGQRLIISVNNIEAEVVGVIKDFNLSSLHEAIEPTLIMNLPFLYYQAGIKVKPENLDQTIAHIEKIWTKKFPADFFEYEFLDENLELLYESETRLFHLFQLIASLAILIGCLGLWGLINFITEQRTKEIGIRKVLGASVSNIVTLLSKDFVKLIIIAVLISSPIAWYFMNKWLENFAFHINLSWGIFVLAGVLVLFVALTTVGLQAIRSALGNPIKALRNE